MFGANQLYVHYESKDTETIIVSHGVFELKGFNVRGFICLHRNRTTLKIVRYDSGHLELSNELYVVKIG